MTEIGKDATIAKACATAIFESLSNTKKLEHIGDYNELMLFLEWKIKTNEQ